MSNPISIIVQNVHEDVGELLLRGMFNNFGQIRTMTFSEIESGYRSVNICFNKIHFDKAFNGSLVEDILLAMNIGMQFPISYSGNNGKTMCIELAK